MPPPEKLLSLVAFTDPLSRNWVSNATRLRQGVEIMDLEFGYGPPPGVWRQGVRFQANGDMRLYGELITATGAVRSNEMLSFTALGTPRKDIASFRNDDSGTSDSPSRERLRIRLDGSLKAAEGLSFIGEGDEIDLRVATDAGYNRWGLFSCDGATRTLTIQNDPSLDTKDLRVDCHTLELKVTQTLEQHRWGMFAMAGATRTLTVQNSDAVAKDLLIDCDTFELQVSGATTQDRWGVFAMDGTTRTLTVQSGAGVATNLRVDCEAYELRVSGGSPTAQNRWGTFSMDSAGTRILSIETSADEARDLEIRCKKFTVQCSDNHCVKFEDVNEAVRYKFDLDGTQTITAIADAHAELVLDATATTGAKKWAIRVDSAGSPAGTLKFINQTDTGTPSVVFDADGSIAAAGFIGGKTTTAAPSDSEGKVGAVAVDTTNKKIWVKVTDSGTGRWWFAALVSP